MSLTIPESPAGAGVALLNAASAVQEPPDCVTGMVKPATARLPERAAKEFEGTLMFKDPEPDDGGVLVMAIQGELGTGIQLQEEGRATVSVLVPPDES